MWSDMAQHEDNGVVNDGYEMPISSPSDDTGDDTVPPRLQTSLRLPVRHKEEKPQQSDIQRLKCAAYGLMVLVIVLVLGICIVVYILLVKNQAQEVDSTPSILTTTSTPPSSDGFNDYVEYQYANSSCRALLANKKGNTNGFYQISRACFKTAKKVYCDQTSGAGGWMRLHDKDGPNSCKTINVWSPSDVECLLQGTGHGRVDIAISDSVVTLNREKSWILDDVKIYAYKKCGSNSSCLSYHVRFAMLGYSYYDPIVSVVNCKTPTGTVWSSQYNNGRLVFYGTLSTMGGWTRMFHGCSDYVEVGDKVTLRTGGSDEYEGEFIHGGCNDYAVDMNNAVTSLWESQNTRVFWIRV